MPFLFYIFVCKEHAFLENVLITICCSMEGFEMNLNFVFTSVFESLLYLEFLMSPSRSWKQSTLLTFKKYNMPLHCFLPACLWQQQFFQLLLFPPLRTFLSFQLCFWIGNEILCVRFLFTSKKVSCKRYTDKTKRFRVLYRNRRCKFLYK